MTPDECLDTGSMLKQMAADKKRITELEARLRSWEAFFESFERYDGRLSPPAYWLAGKP